MRRLEHEDHIKSLFIKVGLHTLRQSVRAYGGGHKSAEQEKLEKYEDLLTALRAPTAGQPQPY